MNAGMRSTRRCVLRTSLAAAFAGLAVPVAAADAAEPPVPVLKVLGARPEKVEIRPGESVRVFFELEPPPRWHLYPAARKPLLGKQTTFQFEGVEVAGPITEPRPRFRREGALESDFHEGKVTIAVPVRLPAGAAPGPRDLKGQVTYQICDWNLCLSGEVPFQFRLTVVDPQRATSPTLR
jgi:DsbC/DsbD-like thiol-disulfide interchange protein